MIRDAGDRLEISGAMTLTSASTLLMRGSAALKATKTCFDLKAVEAVDSSALAVIFGWQREAQKKGTTLTIAHPPQDLLSLAELYGVSELLPLDKVE
jgi:phospholipid transport system transporter-binding protein